MSNYGSQLQCVNFETFRLTLVPKMKILIVLSATLFTFLLTSNLQAQSQAKPESPLYKIKMKNLAGKDVSFSKYAGKVVVFVNVASKCGFTPQYKELQGLHEEYVDKGVVVIGVPCNQFGGQEPGTAEQIATFCRDTYGVEFEMLEKVDVKGDEQCELYKFLTDADVTPAGKGPVKWNFEKIVVNRAGKPIARFRSNIRPSDPEFQRVIERALQEKVSIGSGPNESIRPNVAGG